MKYFLSYWILLVSVVMLVFQAGCRYRNAKPIIRCQEILDSRKIDKITILPVADGRVKIDKRFNFEKETSKVQERLISSLKSKGYDCVVITDMAALAMEPQQIPFADSSQIPEIGPDKAIWVMVPIVDRIDNPYIGNTYSSVACYFFDKSIGKLVWEGSIIGVAVSMHDSYLEDAFYHLMKEFPEKSR